MPVYGDGRQVRDWIHVLDHCRGIDAALRRGRAGEVYNFGGKSERYNIDVTRAILELCGKTGEPDPVRHRPPGPRPPLRHQLRQGRSRAGLAPDRRLRGRPGRHRRVVPDPCRLGRARALGSLSRPGEVNIVLDSDGRASPAAKR